MHTELGPQEKYFAVEFKKMGQAVQSPDAAHGQTRAD